MIKEEVKQRLAKKENRTCHERSAATKESPIAAFYLLAIERALQL